MSGFWGAIKSFPLSAMILVTEMVGDIRNFMPLACVSCFLYYNGYLLKYASVYDAMLENASSESISSEGEVTFIEIPVSDKIWGKQVHELNLPHRPLITTQLHNGKSNGVNGSQNLYL